MSPSSSSPPPDPENDPRWSIRHGSKSKIKRKRGIEIGENDPSLNENSSDSGNDKGNYRVSNSSLKNAKVFYYVEEKGSVSREANPDESGFKETELRSSGDVENKKEKSGVIEESEGFLNSLPGARKIDIKMKGIDLDCDGIGNANDLSVLDGRIEEEEKESDGRLTDGIRIDIDTVSGESNPANGKGRYIGEEDLVGLNPEEFEPESREMEVADFLRQGLLPMWDKILMSVRRKASQRKQRMRELHERHCFIRERIAQRTNLQPIEGRDHSLPLVRGSGETRLMADLEVEDGTSPFATAMKIIEKQTMQLSDEEQNPTSDANKCALGIEWIPSKDQSCYPLNTMIPSLQHLSANVLAKNAEAIVSLKEVPDVLRCKLSQLVCDSRGMDYHFMNLLVSGSPSLVGVKDCSHITEEQLTKIFEECDTNNLKVLQLDLCGRCMSDCLLHTTLALSPNRFSALTAISLRGACRLTNIGLKSLVASAPSLRSINLGQCSLLTATGIKILAGSLGSLLRELYIDGCPNIDVMLILHALTKLEHLEVLSVADNQTVCDGFVCHLINVCGPKMKELDLADCGKLTDASVKVITECCPGLRALNLVNLNKLTDSAMLYLANGCRSIQKLKLCCNKFSDEAIAAFLQASGGSLKELSLNNVNKVGQNTAISMASCSRNLLSLDLSWCRNLTDGAVGLIVDSCLSLRVLKLFGCCQITKLFTDGHSNPFLRVIGLNLTPLLPHLNMLGPQEGPLCYYSEPSYT